MYNSNLKRFSFDAQQSGIWPMSSISSSPSLTRTISDLSMSKRMKVNVVLAIPQVREIIHSLKHIHAK